MIYRDFRQCVVSVVDNVCSNSVNTRQSILSGIEEVDLECGGLLSGDMVLLLSPPDRSGVDLLTDTVLKAMSVHRDVKSENCENVGLAIERCVEHLTYWSLCDDIDTITLRFLSKKSSIPISRLSSGRINDDEWSKLTDSIGFLSDNGLDVTIIDSSVPLSVAIDYVSHSYHSNQSLRHFVLIDSVSVIRTMYDGQPLISLLTAIASMAAKSRAPVIIVHSMPWSSTESYLTLEEQKIIRGLCKYIGEINSLRLFGDEVFVERMAIRWYR